MAHAPASQHAPIMSETAAQAEQSEPIRNVPPPRHREGRLTVAHVPFGAQQAPRAESHTPDAQLRFGANMDSELQLTAKATSVQDKSEQQAPPEEK